MHYKLEDICEFIRNGASIKQNDNIIGYPITRIETIANSYIDLNRMGYAGIIELGKYEEYLLNDGDILMSHINSEKHLGKTAIYEKCNEKIIHGMNLLCLRPKKNIVEPKYLNYYFNNLVFRRQLPKITKKSVNQASFAVTDLKNIKVILPTKDTQLKVVKILDKAQELIDKRKEQIKTLDELVKSKFIEMFGDPINNPMGWQVKKLKDISTKILSGNTPKGGSEVYVDSGIMFFRSQNVWKNKLVLDDIAYIDEDTHNKMLKSSLKHRDILMTKTGRINTENSSLGRAAMYLGEDDKANINGHVYLIRLKEEILNEFILFILTSKEYRGYIRSVCVGGIDKRQLNKEHIEDFPIIFPPIEQQKEFVTYAKQVDKLKFEMEKSLKELEDNFNSLMQKAFKGELFN